MGSIAACWDPPYQVVSCTAENNIRQYSVRTLKRFDKLYLIGSLWSGEGAGHEFIGRPITPRPGEEHILSLEDCVSTGTPWQQIEGIYHGNGSVGVLELPSIAHILGIKERGNKMYFAHIPSEIFVGLW